MEIVSKSHPTSLVVVDLREILADFCWDGDFGEGPLIFRLFFLVFWTTKHNFPLACFLVLKLVSGMFFLEDQRVGKWKLVLG